MTFALREVSDLTAYYLARIPAEFVDDGMSWFPDKLFGFDLRPYARIHDWLYCTRAQPRGTMAGTFARRHADGVIRGLILADAPPHLRWIAAIVFVGVRKFGKGAYDSCGPWPDGATDAQKLCAQCRHGLVMPTWMNAGSLYDLADGEIIEIEGMPEHADADWPDDETSGAGDSTWNETVDRTAQSMSLENQALTEEQIRRLKDEQMPKAWRQSNAGAVEVVAADHEAKTITVETVVVSLICATCGANDGTAKMWPPDTTYFCSYACAYPEGEST